MSGAGKPSELHPRTAATELGLHVEGVPSWPALLDAAVSAYWERRQPITRAELATYRREVREQKAQQRREALRQRQEQQDATPPAVWIRRAGAA